MEEKSRRPEGILYHENNSIEVLTIAIVDTPFKQQKLKAWQPILTPNWVIGTFALVGLIFIPIGIILRIESDNVCYVLNIPYCVLLDVKLIYHRSWNIQFNMME